MVDRQREALLRLVEAVLPLLESEECYHSTKRQAPWKAEQEDEYRRRLDAALLARDAYQAARSGRGEEE